MMLIRKARGRNGMMNSINNEGYQIGERNPI
jgi:hypothetical protein